MLRMIGAVVAGYFAMALVVFVGLTSAYLGMGPEAAFRPGSYEISALWVAVMLVIGFGAALLGGWLAAWIARSTRGAWWLAGVVVVLGLAMAVPVLLGDAAELAARPEGLGAMEAMADARTPLWAALLNPLIGAVGVLLGGGALRPARPAPEPEMAA